MAHAMGIRRIQDAEVSGKVVLVRVDYNVPLAGTTIKDDGRIRASIPTIELLIQRGATVVLATHLGRPDGVAVEELRLDPIGKRLGELLGRPVRKLNECIGPEVVHAARSSAPGAVLLLENVRFHREEEENDAKFSDRLAEIADVYVDDAFGTAHRAHATTVGVAQRLPAYAGLLIQKEVDILGRLVDAPARPYLAIVGGKKASDKLGVLRDLVPRVDGILIGGGVAFTFLAATGANVGDSRIDAELLEDVRGIAQLAAEKGTRILLPSDAMLAPSLRDPEKASVGDATCIPHGLAGFDIGPRTVAAFAREIALARSLVWAGPMGVFETPAFAAGTRGVAEAVATSGAFSVIGGGETGEAVQEMGYADRVTFISTGGGACLAFIRGKTLPALAVLQE